MNKPSQEISGYLIFWIGWLFYTPILAGLLTSSGGMGWKHALVLGALLSASAQVGAWSAVFSCRTAPLGRTPWWRLVLTHVTAAFLLTFFWVMLGSIYAWQLDSFAGWRGTLAEFSQKTALLRAANFFYYLMSVAFNYALMAQRNTRQAEELALESSLRARDAELSALKAQINPHFLYNSLNSISALTSIDAARAREMCVSLADFLRLTLGMGEKPVISLREELGLLEKYCAIEKVRFGARLRLEEEIQEEAKACLLPPLLLQPLLENAVVHGIAQMPEGGWIRLRAARDSDRVFVTVENSWDPEAGSARKNGVGLKNVQRRLEARYGQAAQLEAKAEEDTFRVSMTFPAETEAAS